MIELEPSEGGPPMDCRARLEGYLKDQGVAFDVQQHAQAFTAQEVAASEHVRGRAVAKVVMAIADGDLLMLVIPAPSMVDVEKAGRVLGRQVRLAEEHRFAPTFPDCEPGAMPPFGNLYDVPVIVDRTMGQSQTMIFQAGTHTVTMSIPYTDFERLVGPTVDDIVVAH
jgi:Ala-tRNA(Pro) deacylase